MAAIALTPSDRGRGSPSGPPAGGAFQRPVKVFDLDPDLLFDVEEKTAAILRDRGIAESVIVEEGRWRPPTEEEIGPAAIGLLVLDGLLCRTVRLDRLESPELLGAGDLLRPWQDDATSGSLALESEWRVLERATVAILDERFARRVYRVPGIAAGLVARAMDRSQWLSFQLAIAHVRRADPRVLMLFWHFADRWGRVAREGVVVPHRLTHATIARLVCMRRPTVSAAIMRLVRMGELARHQDGTWILTGAPPDLSTITRWRSGSRSAA